MGTKPLSLARYRALLAALEEHLRAHGDIHWPTVLSAWLDEVDDLDPGTDAAALLAHLLRVQKATGGMGSLADIVICPEAGHPIEPDERVIASANQRLLELVHDLYEEVRRLIPQVSDQTTGDTRRSSGKGP